MLRLMCVTAHPDDEAGGFGGALALYRERGVETYVVCLTPGQAARNRGGARSDEELSALRRKEFAAACALLKITQAEVLGYPDAGLDRVDLRQAVGEVTLRVRQLRPHVILTFGPEGAITGHPDHSMASLIATLAYHWAGREDRFPEQLQDGLCPHRAQKLYYSTAAFTLPDRPPVALPPSTAGIEISPQHLETKIQAFKLHTSQGPLHARFEETMRKRGHKELFHLAAAITPRRAAIETDLFAGVTEESS
ncbi:MAG TPA: PIG-L family deacetylase [Terriglobales bacterium]|jgi:LmbE family N-acetylglucosaminyl deacetylase|nr:PIG-L family deacetylase [Terriglobales bacterium]